MHLNLEVKSNLLNIFFKKKKIVYTTLRFRLVRGISTWSRMTIQLE
jgi:hypothetical protein